MIQLKDLQLSYGENVILDNISYNFNRNRIYGLVGQNGVGKTTFLNCIARVNQTCSGLITCDERNIVKLSYIETDIVLINSDKVFF